MLLEELIHERENGEKYIDGRELHTFLEVDTEFAKWIKRKIDKHKFEENYDYIHYFRKELVRGRLYNKVNIYELSLNTTKLILNDFHSKISVEIKQYLYKIDNKTIDIILDKRFENSFGDKLINTLKPLNIKVETQKPMFNGKYRIDFYLPEFNLAIEYDEEQHKYQQEEDKQREEGIKEVLGCRFIRLDYKQDDNYNVGLVLKEIMGR